MSISNPIRRVRLLQLPVPTLVPEESTGNICLGAGALVAHIRESSSLHLPGLDLEVLSGRRVARLGDAALLSGLTAEEPDVIGFTVTAWNVERTLAFCGALRRQLPHARIWLGGPEVAPDAWFVQPGAPERVLFDAAVQGEGEAAFEALLAGTDPLLVPGSVWSATSSPPQPVTASSWPSAGPHFGDPFLSGVVEPDLDGTVWVELSRGCLHGCAFCRYHGGRGSRVVARTPESIAAFFRWARSHDATQIYILDPSLEQHPYLDELLQIIARENPPPRLPLCVEMRAEAVDSVLARHLFKAGVARVECGLQTLTPEAMRRVGRRVDWPRFVRGVEELADAGIEVRVDIMLGLPGDSPDQMERLFGLLHQTGIAGMTQPFRTQVLPGTRLRALAPKWDLLWEPRPPYRVLQSPTWDASHLRTSLAWAGGHLGVNTAPDDEPLLSLPLWAGRVGEGRGTSTLSRERSPFPGSQDGVAQYSFNLLHPDGEQRARDEQFQQAGFPCVLWMSGNRETMPLSLELVSRFERANPFVPATVVVEMPQTQLWECVAQLSGALTSDGYLDRAYEGAGLQGGLTRRLYLALPVSLLRDWERSQLGELRRRARLLWLVPVARWEEVGRAVGRWPVPAQDLLLLATSMEGPVPDGVFQHIMAESFYPDQVVWDRPDRQWRWTRYLDRVRGERSV